MKRLLALVLVVFFSPTWAAEEAAPDLIEPEAIELLRAASGHLANVKIFRLRSRIEFDSVQENGQNLEFGASRIILVERPDKARIETSHRDGRQTELILDGQRIWYYTPEDNAYGSASQPGGLGASLDFVARELGVPQPLSDLLAADPYREFAEGLSSAVVVGDSEIDGVACLHAAYRNDVGDLQLWISQADDAQIQRLIITYRDEPGHPQFRADLVEFDPDAKISSDSFVFSPPEDAERLRFVVPGGADADSADEGE